MHRFDFLEVAILTRLVNAAESKSVYVKACEFGATSGEFARAIGYLEQCGLIDVSWHDGRRARRFGFWRRTHFHQCRGRLSQQGLEALGGAVGGVQRSGLPRAVAGNRQARALSRW